MCICSLSRLLKSANSFTAGSNCLPNSSEEFGDVGTLQFPLPPPKNQKGFY